jgi:hypothetical protein
MYRQGIGLSMRRRIERIRKGKVADIEYFNLELPELVQKGVHIFARSSCW